MIIEMINQFMNILLVISSTSILLGAIFKLQHYPQGDLIFCCGIWSNFILSSYEIG
jgi:hypothetical protein